ncbi:hypothetical protein BDD43_2099 [Mucilaginibacter gracilis]|uniref:Uncharacterized protein n=1 Tax=Mucilaginibacter gracilis TaxID=423350 RepID=A0A495IZ30_9SPHI|nr:hypothetical protein [Mucilaginibacter gracilis]RKR81937.1 hypothetical protein BDD43_2099 [Mucilaginibacter gracilis]
MKRLTTGPIILIAAFISVCIVAYENHASQAKQQDIPVANYTNPQTAIIPDSTSVPDTAERNEMVDIQVMFAKNGYQYCEFYDEYKQWEAQANKMDDEYYQAHPDAPGVAGKKADKWLDLKVSKWLKKHHLPDSLGNTIAFYGPKVCNN